MKKILTFIFVAAMALMNTGCLSPSGVDAGEEGVFIYKPWVFGHGGVDSEPLRTGLAWTVWSTSVERYNIKPVKYTESFIDLTATDNVAIDFNSYLTLQVIEGMTPVLHEKFGKLWYVNNVKDFYRTVVRNEGRMHSSIGLRTKPEIIGSAQDKIHADIAKYIKSIDLPVLVVKAVIGKVIPPDEVLAEAERTAAQKQREQTQVARAKAELSRAQAEANKALADKAFSSEFRMTTKQFLRNKELDIIEMAVQRKDSPVTVIMNSSDATPIFNAK